MRFETPLGKRCRSTSASGWSASEGARWVKCSCSWPRNKGKTVSGVGYVKKNAVASRTFREQGDIRSCPSRSLGARQKRPRAWHRPERCRQSDLPAMRRRGSSRSQIACRSGPVGYSSGECATTARSRSTGVTVPLRFIGDQVEAMVAGRRGACPPWRPRGGRT